MKSVNRLKSSAVFRRNERYIPGGVVSSIRRVEPELAFARGKGAYIWDVDGNRYVDYHAAFAPHLLGHCDGYVTEAVEKVIRSGVSLYGTGTNELEGKLAQILCTQVEALDKVEFCNTGTEASMAAVRIARAATKRDHVIVMQGGYNGAHNDVACNVLTPLDKIGPRVSPGEYPYVSLGAGVPEVHKDLVHNINFNDLDSVRYVCERYSVAALITEPILQNIGLVKPVPGYLEGLRDMADHYGFVLVFDEVKTGFRYCVGGYSQLKGINPDIAYFAKAIANGYPISVVGGKAELMDYCAHPDSARSVMVAGTYAGHPISMGAAIATLERLLENEGVVYKQLESLGQKAQDGIESIIESLGLEAVVVRQGSAFCIYFMDHAPKDWHDLAVHHNFSLDLAMRRSMIRRGIYFFPVATKQCSISAAHSEEDIDITVEALGKALLEVTA
ncbi:MAG: Glutamate-1-semialdehyde 2,1-aminomutase 1 [Candidatus Moanabacter tarae]|uniref:Glutamate-1-semialdehyde 2,1-aminomutase 1 n=1 Tax=Candidatus Moanibacter tarae TaxID=2200854 RepID=A0A2Z4AQW1_9BACT|nr:MAG: Glutamate-1-semialdehyde 2,1-aminomutase 1 [Candidatus Moanabacter tarae]|tara:strand:- start:2239 stop:3573 length:1335 start_codon:yes stop_codon:yes gene_type:complete